MMETSLRRDYAAVNSGRIDKFVLNCPSHRGVMFTKPAFCLILIAAADLFIGTVHADVMSFSNVTNIPIRDGDSASLYPSPITVSGMTGTVSKVTVQLKNLTHSQPADVDVLLVGPTGARFVLFSDAGGSNSIFATTVTLDDTSASVLPMTSLTTGSYNPADFGGLADVFLPPAPAIAFPGDSAAPAGTSTFATKFAGTNPNGVWSLYIMDDTTNGLSGSLGGGWVLTVTTVPSLPQPVLTNAMINISGKFQFGFTGVTGTSYSVLVSNNLASWSILGTASEISAGVFRYIDPQPPTNAVRYYRVHSP